MMKIYSVYLGSVNIWSMNELFPDHVFVSPLPSAIVIVYCIKDSNLPVLFPPSVRNPGFFMNLQCALVVVVLPYKQPRKQEGKNGTNVNALYFDDC